jgi:phosphoglycolate phosphatase
MRCLVFDLDGTLIDSVPDLMAALNRLMAAHGLAGFAAPEVTAMVGDGAAALVNRALAARGRAPDAAAVESFVADYTDHAAEATRAFPGVLETLPVLAEAGWRMAVCTNKPAAAAREVLGALDMARYFTAIGGGDSYPVRKPDPAHLLATLRDAGGAPGRTVMVGDHRNDVAAAAGAGLPCIFAGWGYGPAAMAEGAASVAATFGDVPEMAERLLGQWVGARHDGPMP